MKIITRIKKIISSIINIVAIAILSVAYFVLFFPLGIFIRLFTDFLDVKKRMPRWVNYNKIRNINGFLTQE